MTTQRGRILRGQRPSSRRVKIERQRAQPVDVARPPARAPRHPSVWFVVAGFAGLILVGTVLLMLPLATRAPGGAEWSTALFTATSAVCVTGLIVVDTHDNWTPFGQAVILLLIQLGGLGFMTSSTILLLVFGRRLSLGQRVMMTESLGQLGSQRLRPLVVRIVLATIAIEAVGAMILVALLESDSEGVNGRELWRGLFISVSAFNNAGFDIEGGFRSLAGHQGNVALLGAVAALITLGGTGYVVWADVVRARRWGRMAPETRVILGATSLLLAGGTALLLLSDLGGEGAFASVAPAQAATSAAFMSVSARTAGFAVFDLAVLSDGGRLVMMALMFVGGAPGSTAGGIKLTTLVVLVFAIMSALRQREQVVVGRRSVALGTVQRAAAVAALATAVVFGQTLLLAMFSGFPLSDVLFEATSAFATVGLSTGITPKLEVPAQLVLVVGMFIGRLGPLTLALALAGSYGAQVQVRYPETPMRIS
jgi:trk system potassium uptake protein